MFLYFKISQRMRWNLKYWPALVILSPALITSCSPILAFTVLPDNMFPNKLAPNMPDNMLRNPSFFLLLHF